MTSVRGRQSSEQVSATPRHPSSHPGSESRRAALFRQARHAMARVCLAILLSCAASASGQTITRQPMFEEGFDGPQPTWRIDPVQGQPTRLAHTRSGQAFHAGGGSELVRFSTDNVNSVRLAHEIPPARQFEEFTSSIWVKSNRTSFVLAARVRFPHATDPRSNQPLMVDVIGDRYSTPQQWQQLTCVTTDAAIRESLFRLHNQIRQSPADTKLDTREAYVDQLVLIVELDPGATEIYLDELSAGPIVAPATISADPSPEIDRGSRRSPRVLIGDDHFRRADGSSFILRFTPHHGESAAALANCGINAPWIRDYTDSELLSEFEQAGLNAIAELPVPPDIGDQPNAERFQFGLIPVSDDPRILFWNIGIRLKPEELQRVSAWAEMVRSSDYELSRPLLGNVSGLEREFHRRLDCLGSSRHSLQTSASPRMYHDFLSRKRDLAFPDKPMFTYIQTEPSPELLSRWPSHRNAPMIESEQIELQCYAALAAGYKGIGYWKHSSLTEDVPGNAERLMAMTLVNRHIELLEPWLATGKITEIVPATFAEPDANAGSHSGWGRQLFGGGRQTGQDSAGESPVLVSVLQSDYGYVLLPVWYEPDAQYQPGHMRAEELFFTISPLGEDVQQAWLVTTTDVTASPIALKRVDGGHQFRLSGFDRHAAIIIAKDPAMIEDLRRRIAATQESSAQTWLDLASEKLRRVDSVHQELVNVAPAINRAEDWLAYTRRLIQQSETDFAAGRYTDCRNNGQRAMAVLRTLQRAHWDRAMTGLTSGVSSPYTICFQTLPDHWRLLGDIGNGVMHDENLLRSGDFEDRDTMLAEGWKPQHSSDTSIVAESQLRRRNAREGDYALHLSAERQSPATAGSQLNEPAIRWISPLVSVYAGQIVHIGGHVLIDQPLTDHTDGLLIYESLHGSLGGLRWRNPGPDRNWQPFQLIREVQESGELRVVIELRGLGEVSIDDIKVIVIDPGTD